MYYFANIPCTCARVHMAIFKKKIKNLCHQHFIKHMENWEFSACSFHTQFHHILELSASKKE